MPPCYSKIVLYHTFFPFRYILVKVWNILVLTNFFLHFIIQMGRFIYEPTFKRCFNGPNSWQLGWYFDRHRTVTTSWNGYITGVADYSPALPPPLESTPVIIQLPGRTYDWYVTYNRRIGVNVGTQEGGDQVLVHKREKGDAKETNLLAKLSPFPGFPSTYTSDAVRVTVNAVVDLGSQGFGASVSVTNYEITQSPSQSPSMSKIPSRTSTT